MTANIFSLHSFSLRAALGDGGLGEEGVVGGQAGGDACEERVAQGRGD